MRQTMNLLRSSASVCVLALVAPVSATTASAGSLPAHGQYVAGSGAIEGSAGGLTIDQKSSSGIIDWQSFSIGRGKTVQFDNGSGATLNEVTGNNLSEIAGSLKATGSVYLVNPSGILVTPSGKVITQGSFAASSTGNVTNEGSISSPTGQVSLISDGHGNVINTGNIAAAQVDLNAAGGNIYALAGNNGGVIRATGTSTRAGHVWLTAGGTTTISGAIAAKNANGSGGTIVATGKSVDLRSTANIDASGTRGGTVLIGGDRHGGAIASEKLVAQNVATADSTNIANGARISANGSAGQGGSVVVWSNKATRFAGTISERGSAGTRGGFAEVSSHDVLGFDGHVELTSFQGATGTLLLDPYNVTISSHANRTETCAGGICTPSGNNSILNVTTLEDLLATTNVDVTTGGTGSLGSQVGNITVAAALTWSSANTLTLDAYHSILIDKPVSITGAGGVDIVTNDGGEGGAFLFGPAGNVTFADLASNLTIDGAAYTLVNNISTLASDIAAHPSGDFALANSYNAGADGTYSTSPVSTAFSGTFDGLGNTISNLSIDDPTASASVGLFSFVNTGGVLANVVLTNANVQAGAAPFGEGALIGLNYGLVIGDSAGGSVSTVSGAIGGTVGGLVGYNVGGTIEDSSSSAAVSCGFGCRAGGLLGFNIEGSGVAIDNSYATGTVSGGDNSYVGGLIGENQNSGIANSYATGSATGGTESEVGGLVGYSESGSIANSHALGIVSGGLDSIAGGLVGAGGSSISHSYATGAVSGIDESFAGGLVGDDFGGKITNSYASGDVTDGSGYYSDAGGLVGYAEGTKFDGDSATGSVTGGEGASAGGLIGYMKKVSIDNSYATGATTVGAAGYAGGLVGQDVSGSIANSNAGGAVTGGEDSFAGGLVGSGIAASSSITNSYATGMATGTADGAYLGGLVGYFDGSITDSYATGAVTGGLDSEAGGLVGLSFGTITRSYASGQVMCGEACSAGGLVAENYGTINASYATGSATGGDFSDAGGLVAGNRGTIENSYATGNVSIGNGVGGIGGGLAGGLVAENAGAIDETFATGTVSGGGVTSVGGLVGWNLYATASIANSYATGSVTGGSNSSVGGLVGFNDYGLISDSYSTGAPVGGTGSSVGGLVGSDYGTDTDDYWDTTTSGITNLSQGAGNFANYPGITGLTTLQLQSGLPAGFSSSIWGENASINGGLPYLLANPPPSGVPIQPHSGACGDSQRTGCTAATRS